MQCCAFEKEVRFKGSKLKCFCCSRKKVLDDDSRSKVAWLHKLFMHAISSTQKTGKFSKADEACGHQLIDLFMSGSADLPDGVILCDFLKVELHRYSSFVHCFSFCFIYIFYFTSAHSVELLVSFAFAATCQKFF